MAELLNQLSDNQLAVLGGVAALGGSLLLLTISFHANPANRQGRQTPLAENQPSGGQVAPATRKAA
jgi:hypothetical protein